MKCTEFEKNINDYIDEELNDISKKDIENHIDECKECKQMYEELLELKAMLSDLDDLDLPENFTEELHEKLEKVSKENKVISLSDRFRKYRAVVSVAAVVLISVVAIRTVDFSVGRSSMDSIESEVAYDESFGAKLANDVAVEETQAVEAEEVVEEAVAELTMMDAADEETVPMQANVFTLEKRVLDISTRKEVTVEIASNIEDISVYLTNKSYDFEASEFEVKILIEDVNTSDFIHEIKSNFDVKSEYYVDYYEDIEEMKLSVVVYEDTQVDIKNSIENETDAETKTNLENEFIYINDMYNETKSTLKEISLNEGVSMIIIRIVSE